MITFLKSVVSTDENALMHLLARGSKGIRPHIWESFILLLGFRPVIWNNVLYHDGDCYRTRGSGTSLAN